MDGNVQEGQVSQETSSAEQAVQPAQVTPSPDLAAQMAEIKAQLAKAVESSRREIQSAKDKAMAEVASAQRRATLAETSQSAMLRALQQTDPETAKTIELDRLRAEIAARQQLEQDAGLQQQRAEFTKQFRAGLEEIVSDLGIDPKDPKIDWAEDAPTPLDTQKRVLKSVAGIKRAADETLKASIKTQIDAEMTKLRKELGADSVDTTTPVASGGNSDAEFLKKWGAGELPSTKANWERASKLSRTL